MEIKPHLAQHPGAPKEAAVGPQVPEKRYPEYYICFGNSYQEVVERVNAKIREGFTMYGSAGYDYHGDNVFQPMIKWVQ